jgi:Trk K+ transport system NAD-binding subunit
MARVLIAGCGDVGAELGVRLVEEGHTVWGLRRHSDTLPSSLHQLVKTGYVFRYPTFREGYEALLATMARG